MAITLQEAHEVLLEHDFHTMAPNVDAYCYVNNSLTRTVFINGREIATSDSLEGLKDLIKTRKQSIMGLDGNRD